MNVSLDQLLNSTRRDFAAAVAASIVRYGVIDRPALRGKGQPYATSAESHYMLATSLDGIDIAPRDRSKPHLVICVTVDHACTRATVCAQRCAGSECGPEFKTTRSISVYDSPASIGASFGHWVRDHAEQARTGCEWSDADRHDECGGPIVDVRDGEGDTRARVCSRCARAYAEWDAEQARIAWEIAHADQWSA